MIFILFFQRNWFESIFQLIISRMTNYLYVKIRIYLSVCIQFHEGTEHQKERKRIEQNWNNNCFILSPEDVSSINILIPMNSIKYICIIYIVYMIYIYIYVLYCIFTFIAYTQRNYFMNLFNPNKIWIVITLFRFPCAPMKFRLVRQINLGIV